ncbi:MAG: hypothetical protein KKC20_10210 [Proteobacteria bacterium]|nr:hypothetical protein [Pseudomonadota bacterium]
MSRIVTGWFRPKAKKRSPRLIMLCCLQCGYLFESSRTGSACSNCGDRATIPAANWAPAKYGMPRFKQGKAENND